MSERNKSGWTVIPIERRVDELFVHTQEIVNGELYVVTIEYNKEGLMVRKIMTHGSLVRG
jgi:hypothetical protein